MSDTTSYIGIDPGITGAIARITDNNISIVDTPTFKIITGRRRSKKGVMVDKIKSEFNAIEMSLILKELLTDITYIGLEKVHAMPKQGVTSQFSFGYGLGIWKGIISAIGTEKDVNISLTQVPPQTWKKEMMQGMGKEKDASVVRALELFPKAQVYFKNKKDHDRADALLIAEYIRRTNG